MNIKLSIVYTSEGDWKCQTEGLPEVRGHSWSLMLLSRWLYLLNEAGDRVGQIWLSYPRTYYVAYAEDGETVLAENFEFDTLHEAVEWLKEQAEAVE